MECLSLTDPQHKLGFEHSLNCSCSLMTYLRLSFLFIHEALVGMEIIMVPGVPGRELVGVAVGPWADPSLVSLDDPLCQEM